MNGRQVEKFCKILNYKYKNNTGEKNFTIRKKPIDKFIKWDISIRENNAHAFALLKLLFEEIFHPVNQL